MIYLDSAATSLIRPQAVEHAMLEAFRSMASPGRGAHSPAMRAAQTVFDCRCRAAKLFNLDEPERIVFTFNATHALNMAIGSLISASSRVLVSGFEHNSVTRPLKAYGADIIIAGRKLFDPADTLSDFESKIPYADLVVCTHVSNVFGYILPIYEIARLCRKWKKPLIIDASQSAGVLEVDAGKLEADYIAMPGHKGLMGPQGTGILICKDTPKPLLHGGSGSDSISPVMPDYLPDAAEAGTHNVCGIAGLSAGIDYILQRGIKSIGKHEREMKDRFVELMGDRQGFELFETAEQCQSGVLSLRPDAGGCEELAAFLGERGVCVRGGLHCAPLAHKSAGSLESGTVRLSFSPFSCDEQLEQATRILKSYIH